MKNAFTLNIAALQRHGRQVASVLVERRLNLQLGHRTVLESFRAPLTQRGTHIGSGRDRRNRLPAAPLIESDQSKAF